MEGASIRIAKLAGELSGTSVRAKYAGPLKRVMAKLRSGQIDATASLPQTRKVKEYAVFSDFYAVDEIVVFKHRDEELRYVKWDNLAGLRIATTAGDSWDEALDEYLRDHARVFRVTSLDNVFRMVKFRRVDVGIHRYYSVLLGLPKAKEAADLKMLHNRVSIVLLHIGFSKESACIAKVKEFNAALRILRRDGTVSRIIQEEFERIRTSG